MANCQYRSIYNSPFKIVDGKRLWSKMCVASAYQIIIAVAEKIPNNVLEEDPKLLMWYDQAVTRVGGE